MGRIPERNKRYRTKSEMSKDVTFVLSAPISYGAKFAVLRDVSWAWTEFSGKYRGCEWWTEMAVVHYCADQKSRRLRHEHIVPRRVVFEMLFKQPHPTLETVNAICEKYLIGVVVTAEEHDLLNVSFSKSMPPEFDDPTSSDFRDPWLRYKQCGLPIVPWERVSTAIAEVERARHLTRA